MGENNSSSSYRTPLYYRQIENLAAELNLSPGEFIEARVVSLLPEKKGRLLLNIRGTQVVAASKLPVQPGDALIVQVKSVAHPIELKIYEPQDAFKKLSPEQLSKILSGMGLETSPHLIDIARRLLEENFQLDPELLEETKESWSSLVDEKGDLISGRFNALRFLYGNKLPVNPELISTIGSVFQSDKADATLWRTVSGWGAVDPQHNALDLLAIVQSLGIDLVNHIGRRPHRASQTVHARLLRSLRDKNCSSEVKTLVGYLLALGLANLRQDGKFHIVIPFREGNLLRTLKLFIQLGKIPEGWREADWWSAAQVEFSFLGPLRFNLQRSRSRLSLTFFSENSEILKLIKSFSEKLINIFEEQGYTVNVDYKNKKPPALPDPFAVEPAVASEQIVTGKVDLKA